MIMYMNNLATSYGIQFLHLQFMMITGETEAQDDATNDEAPVNENFDQQAQAEQVPPAPPPQAPVRRSTIERRPSTRYHPYEYVMLTDGGEPESYPEAMAHDKKDEWLKAMQEELKSLHENHTYDLVKFHFPFS